MTQPMEPPSNPIRSELAKARAPQPHLDTNVLTAFSEGTLLPREREKTMEHLHRCAYCRELVNLSTSAAPESHAEEPVSSRLSPNRKWVPRLAAVAVCTAVLVAVVVV